MPSPKSDRAAKRKARRERRKQEALKGLKHAKPITQADGVVSQTTRFANATEMWALWDKLVKKEAKLAKPLSYSKAPVEDPCWRVFEKIAEEHGNLKPIMRYLTWRGRLLSCTGSSIEGQVAVSMVRKYEYELWGYPLSDFDQQHITAAEFIWAQSRALTKKKGRSP